jgi:RecA/RadA recombinase
MSSTKKKTRKVTKKTTKKATAKKATVGVLDEIASDLKDFQVKVYNKDTVKDDAPYIIPFRHRGLQKISGGIIGGTFAEISGESGGGKSFHGYELIAECQKMDGVAVLFDGENAWDDAYAKMMNINTDNGTFMISKERDIDKVFNLMIKTIKAVRKKKRNIPILFVIDSYYTLATKTALENDDKAKEAEGYYHKRKNGHFSTRMDTFVPMLGETDSTLVLLNQTRLKEENMITKQKIYKTLCEEVIQFIATQRLQITFPLKQEKKEVKSTNSAGKTKIKDGFRVVVETIKNRTVRPFQKVTVIVKYDGGLRRNSGLVELFVNEGLIDYKKINEDREGNKTRTKQSVAVVKETGEMFFSINELIKAHPEFLKSKLTADSIQIEEDNEDFE